MNVHCFGCGKLIYTSLASTRLCPDCRLVAIEGDAIRCALALGIQWDASIDHDIEEAAEVIGEVEGCYCCCPDCRRVGMCRCRPNCYHEKYPE